MFIKQCQGCDVNGAIRDGPHETRAEIRPSTEHVGGLKGGDQVGFLAWHDRGAGKGQPASRISLAPGG